MWYLIGIYLSSIVIANVTVAYFGTSVVLINAFTKTATGWAFSSNNVGTHYEGVWALLIDQALEAFRVELETLVTH